MFRKREKNKPKKRQRECNKKESQETKMPWTQMEDKCGGGHRKQHREIEEDKT